MSSKESPNSSRMVAWILASVAKSMLEVASSRMMMLLFLSNARAMAMSCLCPCEKFVPPAETLVSNVIGALLSVSVLVGDATEDATVRSPSLLRTKSRRDDGRDGSRDVR